LQKVPKKLQNFPVRTFPFPGGVSREARPFYEFGTFRLDLSEHMLLRDGHPVPLTPKVFDVLRVLVQNGGHLVEKEKLLKEVWPDSFVEEGTLNRSVSVLRKALGESPSEQKYIETVPKRGYRFVAPVTEHLHESSKSSVEPHSRSVVDIEATHTDLQSLPNTSMPPAVRAGISKRAAGIAGALLTVGALSYAVLGPSEPERNAPPTLAPAHRQVTFTGKQGAPTLSPDGKRVAYVSDETPEKKLMVQELAGGQPLAVFSAPEVGHLRWSPDGSELIVWARGSGKDGLYVMPQLGGTPRRVVGDRYIACWSPDGSTIAVPSYLGGKIWFLNKLGREQRTVSLQGVHWSIWDIDWSPANGLLTFVSNDYQGRYTIWTIRPDGSDQKSVISENTEISSARWAPQGDAIYYFRRLNQTVSLDKILVPPGHENGEAVATTLITGLETDRSFALSANGKRLVYARAPYHSNLWMLEAGGHGKNQRTEAEELTQGTSLIERPSVSPDGTSIVFNIGHEGLANLYTMPITGGSPKQLTFLNSFSLGGVWSADGKWIAFASIQGGKPRVWTVDAGGGIPRALSSSDLSDSFDLAWSPGSQILYQQAGNRNYYELDPETREERLLVKDSSVGWIFSPVYSPDTRKIAVFWNRRPNRGIWVIDTKDRHETPVYMTSAATARPVGWSADGSSIYVVAGKNAASRGLTARLGETVTDAKILMVPLNGGEVKTVAALPFEEIGSVSMTPDGRRFVFPVYSSRSDVWVVDNFDFSPEPRITRTQ
jgi:Tol biopolymer transport system component/DNA-binding winged helix-turn-helix (wHTH) protein